MKLIDQNTASILSQSSMLIGEAVFTSLLYYNQRFIFLDEHLQRLLQGANFLFPDANINMTFIHELKGQLKQAANAISDNRSVRITITKEGYFFEFRPWNESKISLDVGLSESIKTESIKPSYLKLSQYALEFYELKKSAYDDLIYLDINQTLTEASTSNLFMIDKSEKIITPPTSSKVLAGILRSKLINFCKRSNIDIIECEITLTELFEAKSVFLTNSIKGIRSINKFKEKKYEKSLILEKIINDFGRYGERIE